MDVPSITYDVRKKTWYLTNDFYFADGLTVIHIPEGFKFDLASIPQILWVIIPPFSLSILAPLIHDYLYVVKGKVMNTTYTWTETDKLFKELMKQEGVGWFRRNVAYLAVRAFGWIYWYDVWKNLSKWYITSRMWITNWFK